MTEVTIRGVTYASHKHAAYALDVKQAAISRAKKRGKLDEVGLTKLKDLRVTIRGVTYATKAEAARALGVTPRAVYDAARRGKLDEVGLHVPMRVRIRGVDYESVSAAAKALGRDPSTIRAAIARGAEDGIGMGRGYRPPEGFKMSCKPFSFGSLRWHSRVAACEALGKPRGYIRQVERGGPKAQENLKRALREYRQKLKNSESQKTC